MVLSNMRAFGDSEAKAILNEIVEEVTVKRGVKRTVEELVVDDTLSKYVESLRVLDWKLVPDGLSVRQNVEVGDKHYGPK